MAWYHLKIFLHTGKLYFGHPSVVAVLCSPFPQLKFENCIFFLSDTTCIQPFFSTCTSNNTLPRSYLCRLIMKWDTNSRCCCNKTPPTTGWTLDFFTRTILKINKVVYEKILSETRAFITSVCEHDCVKFRRRIVWHSFLENNFAEFFDEVRVIINKNFVQTLVAFWYSIICYCIT